MLGLGAVGTIGFRKYDDLGKLRLEGSHGRNKGNPMAQQQRTSFAAISASTNSFTVAPEVVVPLLFPIVAVDSIRGLITIVELARSKIMTTATTRATCIDGDGFGKVLLARTVSLIIRHR